MKAPNTCQFTKEHLWVKLTNSDAKDKTTWLVGITDYAQELLGDIVFIEPPKLGSTITTGQSCGIVESVKTGADLFAPLSGEVVEINTAVIDAPESIHDKPYSAWIFKMETSVNSPTSHLMNAEAYNTLLKAA